MRTSNGKGLLLSMLGKVIVRRRPSADLHPCKSEVMANDLFQRLNSLKEEDDITTTSSSHDLVCLSTLRESTTIIQEAFQLAMEEDLGSSNLVEEENSKLFLDICHSIKNSIAEMHSLERLLTIALRCLDNNDDGMLCSSQASKRLQRERARNLFGNSISNMDALMWDSKAGPERRRRSSRKAGSSFKENGCNLGISTRGEDCVLASLYCVASTFLAKYVTSEEYSMKKKNSLRSVELHEAHKYAKHLVHLMRDCANDDNSSFQRLEVNQKEREKHGDMRWCVKQLRQHVEEMAKHLKPLEKQLGSLMFDTRRNIIMP